MTGTIMANIITVTFDSTICRERYHHRSPTVVSLIVGKFMCHDVMCRVALHKYQP